MRLSHFLGAICLLAAASLAFAGRAIANIIHFAVPRFVDAGAYLALSPSPRSIFDTRRMGLA